MSAYYIVTFSEFVGFAAQQSELFEALFQQRDRELSESDLVALVERSRRRDAASNVSIATVVRKLKELRVIEDSGSGEYGSSYRYADTLADLHEYLAQTLAPIGDRVTLHRPSNLAELFGSFHNEDLLKKEKSIELLTALRREDEPVISSILQLIDRYHAGLEHESLLIVGG